MAFEKTVPQWYATGTEPPEDLKNTGFTGGYKPPAAFFNWFWHGVSQCLTELQDMTPDDIGAMANGTVPVSKGGTGATSTNGAVINLLQKTLVSDSNQVDANTFSSTGIYRCYFETTDPTTLHFPSKYGTMFVFGSNGYLIQIFADVAAYRLYYRTSVNGGKTWIEWRRCATLTELESGLDKKANAAHVHSADDLTSGTVPIARGGTGASSIKDALINLLTRGLIDADNAIDANTLTGIGIYRSYFDGTSIDPATLNYPARYGDMFVFGASSYVVQLFVDMASTRMYFRSTSNGGNTWSSWQRHATTNSSGLLAVSSGGTGATNGAAALKNLGIVYSATEPEYAEGMIWLKPVD